MLKDVRGLQSWLFGAIVGGEASTNAAEVLTDGPSLDADGRLGIYRHGYRARLVESGSSSPSLRRLELILERFGTRIASEIGSFARCSITRSTLHNRDT